MDNLPLEFHLEARREADAAFDYYRERSPRAAEAFYLELERARTAIQDSPESWMEYLHGTRAYLLKRFPYIVAYRITGHRVEVLAVAHITASRVIGPIELPEHRKRWLQLSPLASCYTRSAAITGNDADTHDIHRTCNSSFRGDCDRRVKCSAR